MSGYADSEKIQYALKTALYRTMQTAMSDSASVERSAPLRVFPTNIMKVNIIEAGKGDIDENGLYVTGHATAGQTADLSDPESTVKNYKIICPVNNVITSITISALVGFGSSTKSFVDGRGTSGTSYPLKQWFFRGHYSGSGEAAFNAANVTYDGLQLAWNSTTNGATPTEADIVPHLKYYLQVQTNYTGVSHSSSADNITYEHGLLKGLIGLDSNFVSTIMVTQGEGGPSSSASLGTSGSQAGDFWFTQPTAGILSFYGVTNKVDASTDLATFNTKYPMVSYVRYTGETGFGAGTGGGTTELISNDTNVSNMIGGTAQTMTTTSFEFDGNVNITGDLAVTGSGAGTFKGVQSSGNNNILISGSETWNPSTTGVYNTSLGWAAGYQMTSGPQNTLIGHNAGRDITTGGYNTALGRGALLKCTTGSNNIAVGYNSLNDSIGGDGYMIAIGPNAMQYYGSRTSQGGVANRYDIAIGYQAMYGSTGNSGGSYNVAIGHQVMRQITTSYNNVCIGRQAGYNHTTGYQNICIGAYAAKNLNTGGNNIIIGYQAGHNSMAHNNATFVGHQAGFSGSSNNTFIGYQAGKSCTNAWNTAVGYEAGWNGMGNYNVAIGDYAFGNGTHTAKHRTTAIGYHTLMYATHADNTALGYIAGRDTTSGNENVFIGHKAGYQNTTGYANTIVGSDAGRTGTSGHSNACFGYRAGYTNNSTYNVFIGKEAAMSCTSHQNVVIGHQAGYSGSQRSNCVLIGNQAGYDWWSDKQVAVGYRALHHKKGASNVAIGYNCMGDSAPDGVYAEQNVAVGAEALHEIDGSSSGGYASGNVAIGCRAGYALTTAAKNVLIGLDAGRVLTTSWGNVIIGWNNGYQLKSGSGSNVLIGLNNIVASGNSTAYYCNCIGYNAGRTLSTGYKNDLIGFNCGYAINSGSNNCGYGAECLRLLTSGTYNTCLGSYSGYSLTTGGHNTFIGVQAGHTHKTGDSNVCIGHNAGYYDETCERSIFIGRHAGCASNKGTGTGYGEGGKNDQLFINSYMSGNTYTGTNQFIYGYMKMDDNPFLKINGDLRVAGDYSKNGEMISMTSQYGLNAKASIFNDWFREEHSNWGLYWINNVTYDSLDYSTLVAYARTTNDGSTGYTSTGVTGNPMSSLMTAYSPGDRGERIGSTCKDLGTYDHHTFAINFGYWANGYASTYIRTDDEPWEKLPDTTVGSGTTVDIMFTGYIKCNETNTYYFAIKSIHYYTALLFIQAPNEGTGTMWGFGGGGWQYRHRIRTDGISMTAGKYYKIAFCTHGSGYYYYNGAGIQLGWTKDGTFSTSNYYGGSANGDTRLYANTDIDGKTNWNTRFGWISDDSPLQFVKRIPN